MAAFEAMSKKVGKSTDDTAKKFGALQLVIGKLPGPLKSVAAGLMGIVSPAAAAVSAIMELASAQIRLSKEAEEAYIQQEVGLARLGAVLDATGAKSWTTTEELKNMATTLRRETGRSTDEIMQMQSVLLGFTGITGANFERLVGNMINMADVMGGSLSSQANVFGRALENPTKSLNALTRQGFVFTEEQKRMVRVLEEAGQLQEAQVIYLEAMENAFGDSAMATREAAGGLTTYKQALEDLKLAIGEFEASGGMTVSRFLREMFQPGYEDLASRYREAAIRNNGIRENREINARGDEAAARYLQDIKTAKELITIIESGKEDMNVLYNAVLGIWNNHSLSWEEREPWKDTMLGLQKYIQDYNVMQGEIQKEANRLESNKKDLGTKIAKIENAYEDTEEGNAERIRKEIADWIKLRDSMFETATGVFTPLENEYKRKINVIIANLQKGRGKIKKEYEDWVKILSRATGYSEKDIGGEFNAETRQFEGGLEKLGTIEKYAKEVSDLVDYMNKIPSLYDALGLDETQALETAADKIRSVLSAVVETGIMKDDKDKAAFDLLMKELNKADSKAKDTRGFEYIQKLAVELVDAGKSSYELAVKRLSIEQKISEEDARHALSLQKQMDYITDGYDIIGEITTSLDDALRSIRSGQGGYGQYIGAKFAEAGMNAVQGTDVGNFAQGFAMGGPIVGLINMLIGAITNVLNSIEGADEVLSPITAMLMEMKDVFKSILLPGLIVSRLLVELGKGLNWLLNVLSFGIMGQLADTYDLLTATNDERQKEEERLRALNEQYKNLYAALKEQEEYYLQQRRHLNAEFAIDNFQQSRSVNDMILSPHGVFSTDPKDYIIATKHPESLMSGGAAPVYITIENHGANVSTEESTSADGARQIKIIVDGIVQQGIASGSFDGAFDAMNQRRNGKRITA